MREILFRGRTTKDKEWVYGDLLHDGYDYDVAIWEKEYKLVTEVSSETVGQFTGLIVKEKRWFEHDIISVRDEGKESYRFVIAFAVCGGVKNVKHTVGYTGFHFIPANEETQRCMDFGARNDPLYWLNAYDCEVIGNIHDNPELLEVDNA